MSFMRPNPFTSPVGQRIERATNESQASEDWGLIMEITDIINETEEGAKDAVKALKKRLFGNKKWKEVIFSLTILETCVKNCQHRFHVPICKQEFCKELVKVIQPNLNPPTIVQEKILGLIQSWADAFKNDPTLQGVVKVYEELKSKSIEFPPMDLDALSPIRTPLRVTPEVDPAMNRPAPTRQPTQPIPGPGPVHVPAQVPPQQQQQQQQQQGPMTFSADHMTKLRRELDLVLGNVRVMSEMLTEMQPGQENPDDLDLLQELNQTCRTMQKRVVTLLSEVTHEEVTGELLRVNDDLNNMFVRFDRYERYRQSQAQSTQPSQAPSTMPAMPAVYPAAAPITAQAPGQGESSVGTLIDLGLDEPAPAYAAAPAPAYPPAAPMGGGMMGPPGVHTMASPTLRCPTKVQELVVYDQLAGLSMTGGSVSNSLGQISNVPTSVNPPPPEDDFDMFAQSRGTTYQDSIRSGSTYQDNTNVDQAGGALAGFVQNRSLPPPAYDAVMTEEQQPVVAPASKGAGGMDEMEQWLTDSDLSKAQDTYAAANTNSDDVDDPGISSSGAKTGEFDKFLQERAQVGETLPTANIGSHSNVTAPASTQQNRQMQMNEAENNMFAL
ncbi:LOW QUALITY PROTEIN: TOM1-like protein 2 [Strongylocentrotus purpuratus]|uniref:TOM1-like protein 2 n=1 Tax=Strongylocentrotus purpuratus TaxID=7668 RepID=A0A7M7NTH6_STRPU|nr:LOW QUALITY PROTEIN: TOM1-like protein 2 [Strongylocentrotus purpuratus]